VTGDFAAIGALPRLSLRVLQWLALVAPAALLVWLAVEGLRISRDVGTWLLRRTASPTRLLVCLLAAKVLVLALAVLLAVVLHGSNVIVLIAAPSAF
jgi:hypothetical protein